METIVIKKQEGGGPVKPREPKIKSGVKEIAIRSCTTPDFLAGKHDCVPHVVIKSQEDDGFLIAHIPKDGFYEGTKESQKCATQWACKAVPPGGPCITSDDACEIQGESIQIKIPKVICGSALYWIEAFLHAPENKSPFGFFVSGYCKPNITKATWHRYQEDNKGPEVTGDVKYGDMLQLHIETEGLNGDALEVTFIGDEADEPLDTVLGQTFQGKLIINFPVKTIWRSQLFNTAQRLLSYDLNISVKVTNERLSPPYEGAKLTVKNDVAERRLEKGNAAPVTVGKVEVDAKKYEMCKYTGIMVKEGDRELILFDQEKPVADLDVIDVIAGSESGTTEVIINLSEFSTDPDVYCSKNNAHKYSAFILDGIPMDWRDKQECDKLTLNVLYPYPDLTLVDKTKMQIFSDIANNLFLPVTYIWPASKDMVKQGRVRIDSCRYTHDLYLNVFPDVKWELDFFLNLTNDLSLISQNLNRVELKEHQKKSGKIASEKRWKNKHTSFGFNLIAEWNKTKSGKYKNKSEFGASYETKFKKLYDLFSSIGAMADGITNKTKGQIRSAGITNTPISFAVKPPNISVKAEWNVEPVKLENKLSNTVGTKGEIAIQGKPVIALEMTIDLLAAIIVGTAGAFSGGTLAPGVSRLYFSIKEKLQQGVKLGTDKKGFTVSADIFMDLIITGTISNSVNFTFNTQSDGGDSKAQIEAENKLGVELKAGTLLKGELVLVTFKAEAYFEAQGSAKASITLGHKIEYQVFDGLYYKPELGFDGLDVEYTISASVGLAQKIAKNKDKINVNKKGEWIIAEDKIPGVIPKFDVVKSLEELFDFSANIHLISKSSDS